MPRPNLLLRLMIEVESAAEAEAELRAIAPRVEAPCWRAGSRTGAAGGQPAAPGEPGDRILVSFGAGHAAILRQLIAADANLELLDAREFLPP